MACLNYHVPIIHVIILPLAIEMHEAIENVTINFVHRLLFNIKIFYQINNIIFVYIYCFCVVSTSL